MASRPPDGGSQREQAYLHLRRLLILQQIPPGERMREPVWAKKLGVNRTALREAFARLEAEGFLEMGTRSGYVVPSLARLDITEVLEVRFTLESWAIHRICLLGRNTPRGLKPLRTACDQLERLLDEGYYFGVAEADRRFHEGLVELAGNHRLAILYNRAPLPIIHPEMFGRAERAATTASGTLQEHREILDAIMGGNVSEAQALLLTHLTKRYELPADHPLSRCCAPTEP